MHSMTGFGRGSAATDSWQATVEISSVNRRQAEIVLQAPRELAELESRVRKRVLSFVSRGRVQVLVNLDRAQGAESAIRVDARLARAFHEAFVEISRSIGQPLLPTASDYLRQTGIISLGESGIDADQAWLAIEPALNDALSAMVTMRENEGAHLMEDLLAKLDQVKTFAKSIAAIAPNRAGRQRELLSKRLRDAGLELDPADERVVRELALFADRCDLSEELTRLNSHFTKFGEYLGAVEPPGRALDFLCQELSREFNTIGAKANDAAIAHFVVQAKTELEKIREQVQNVE